MFPRLSYALIGLFCALFCAQICSADPTPLFSHRQEFLHDLPAASSLPGGKLKIAFLDLDGTLRVSNTNQEIITEAMNIRLLPKVADKLKKLKAEGYFIAIVTNHAWVPQTVGHEKASELIYHSIQMLEEQGATIDYYDYAGDYAAAAKPNIGMGTILGKHLQDRLGLTVDYANSLMVGDDGYGQNPADRGFARNLGIRFVPAQEFFEWQGCDPRILKPGPLVSSAPQ